MAGTRTTVRIHSMHRHRARLDRIPSKRLRFRPAEARAGPVIGWAVEPRRRRGQLNFGSTRWKTESSSVPGVDGCNGRLDDRQVLGANGQSDGFSRFAGAE